jgi:Mrp family chromosome partitioning ATPase
MSNVNQAFLRAYLKHRAADGNGANEPEPHSATQPVMAPSFSASQKAFSNTQAPKATPIHLGENHRGRIDPAHSAPIGSHLAAPSQPSSAPSHAAPIPRSAPISRSEPISRTAPVTAPVPSVAPVVSPAASEPISLRPNVWSPLGVERGMKSTATSTSSPAVIRNAVAAVPLEATLQRPSQPPVQPAAGETPSPSLETLTKAWSKQRAPALKDLKPRSPAPDPLSAIPVQKSTDQSGSVVAPVETNVPREQVAPASPVFRTLDGKRLRIDPSVVRATNTSPTLASPAVELNYPAPTPIEDFSLAEVRDNREVAPAHPLQQTRIDAPMARGSSVPHWMVPEEIKSRQEFTVTPQPFPVHTQTEPSAREAKRESHRNSASTSKTVDRQQLQSLPLTVAFAASWEVDTFFWPEVLMQLERSNPNSFREIGYHLAQANASGLKVMAVTSGERGVGRSTVAMHMARSAAAAGLKVALVDADAFTPSLVDQLRLDVQLGWQSCLFEAVPLEEIAVHSVSDNVTLFPLTSTLSQEQVHVNLLRISKLVRRISTAFDLVILDSSRLNLDQRDLAGVSTDSAVDAAVVVVDSELSIKEKIDSAISILQTMGLGSIGLVENFRA